jgi:hypothetical protein
MDTTHAATTTQIRRSNIGTTGAATWTIQPWTDRSEITKVQRSEARSMERWATKRHAEHVIPSAWDETWCRICRRAATERRITELDRILSA